MSVIELPGGIRLPYVTQGATSGTPLLLLHGLADSWRSFELVLPHLPPSIQAFAITQRGHGDASRPVTGYRPSDFAADLDRALDALQLEAAVLVGHSSHTFVVQRYAVDHPDRTLGLVLISAPATLRGKGGVGELLTSLSKLTDPIDPQFVRSFAQETFYRPLPPAFIDAMVTESLKMPAFVWREAFQALPEADLGAELSQISAPVLLIWGDRDSIVPRGDQDALLAAIPGASLVVYKDTGHSPHWEEPIRFARDLEAFVRSLAR